MGRARPPGLVKAICGLLGSDLDLLRRARQLLARRLGPIDIESEIWPFTQTEYYRDEMGPDLKRQFVSFARWIRPDQLAEIKVETNAMEEQITRECALLDVPRPVNLDPGYVDLGKLVLATTKDRAHRIYLQQGIYAEVTLTYVNHAWQAVDWTYPDFRETRYHAFFSRVRDCLHEHRRAGAAAATEWTDAEVRTGNNPDDEPPIPFDDDRSHGPRTP